VDRAPALGERLYRSADTAANLPFRGELIELPRPVVVGSTRLDVVDDLATYTELPREVVERELRTRSGASFRAEWYATPVHLRRDHWFYLSSKTYLFANAVHFPDLSFVERYLRPHLRPATRVLDFGAGTGNLALLLAASGLSVTVFELSAIQRDFIRFRVARHELCGRVEVLDPWAEVAPAAFGAVVAVDVLEHLPNCQQILERRLLPALDDEGVLVENSPFVVNTANPMHHEDFGFEPFMHGEGFQVLTADTDGTRVWCRQG
jgi:SAM-dependent methyltransferase